MLKVVFDKTVALAALVVMAPSLLLVALLVRLRLGSPVLFRQERTGYRGRPFHLYKFRTMRDAHDAHGRPLPDEERLTPLGAFLRRYSLDELPQLVNVLRGEVSLVGPRPLMHEYWELYSPEQARRFEVRPGITGWAQINGRNTLSWEEKFALDVWYVDNRSFWLDLRILGLTALRLLHGDGVSAGGHVTMPRFTGTPTDTGQTHPRIR